MTPLRTLSLISMFVLALPHCSKSSSTSSTCGESSACLPGYACIDGACRFLCESDDQCAAGEICQFDIEQCVACVNCRSTPMIETLNGTGSADTAPGRPTGLQHLTDRVVITGTHLDGGSVFIDGGAFSHTRLELTGDVTSTQLVAKLPTDISVGTYTLSVSNQAGRDDAIVNLLQGEKGETGDTIVYTGSNGISVQDTTISPTYGTIAGTIAEGNHAHSIYALQSDLTTANTSITTHGTTLTNLRTGLGNLPIDCTVSGSGLAGTTTYDASNGTWSTCSTPSAWNCTTQPSHAGCIFTASTSPYASCKAIRDNNYSGSSGVFLLDSDDSGTSPSYLTYCDMTTSSGGWTLAINLDTGDQTTRRYEDTDFWTSNTSFYGTVESSRGFAQGDIKTRAYLNAFNEIMLVAHDNGTLVFGRAIYTRSDNATSSLSGLFLGAYNQTLTAAASPQTGSVGSFGRAWNLGDGFIDHGLPIIINSNYKYSAPGVQTVRIGYYYETLASTNSFNEYNLGGWGGMHRTESGGLTYGDYFEGAAACHYCVAGGGCIYGTNNYSTAGATSISACYWPQAQPPVDLAVFIR